MSRGRSDEIVLCGLSAVTAVLRRRPQAVRKLFFDESVAGQMGEWCGHLSGAHKPWRKVSSAELERIAATVHHGGVAAVVERLAPASPSMQDIREWKRRRKPVLLLDRIGNPHNLGAIVRSAAFFGVRILVLSDSPEQATPSASAYRVAEGGMEHVDLYVVHSLAAFCRQLAREFLVVGTDVGRGKDIDLRTPPGTAARPAALVLGNEETGLAPDVAAACGRLIRIPGSGALESLNVSAAAAVLLGWLTADRDSGVARAAGR